MMTDTPSLSPAEDSLPIERYEREAEEFYRETGIMAPGKSVPLAIQQPEYGVRWAAFMNWLEKRRVNVR